MCAYLGQPDVNAVLATEKLRGAKEVSTLGFRHRTSSQVPFPLFRTLFARSPLVSPQNYSHQSPEIVIDFIIIGVLSSGGEAEPEEAQQPAQWQ